MLCNHYRTGEMIVHHVAYAQTAEMPESDVSVPRAETRAQLPLTGARAAMLGANYRVRAAIAWNTRRRAITDCLTIFRCLCLVV
jgi:hypothetical protein